MADYETRPLSIYRSGDWHSNANGHVPEAGPSSGRASRSSISNSSLTSRRRSSAATVPPAGPPPTHPIPSLPIVAEALPYGGYSHDEVFAHEQESGYTSSARSNSPVFNLDPFQRPTASSQLAAVAQFSQARLAAASASPPSSSGNLSDSPPRSLLPRSSRAPQQSEVPHVPSQEIIPDRLLLSPPEPRSPTGHGRPSSRRALTRALELAREAVRLDSTNDDPHAAIQAYGQSVALLNEVMERVMRGEDSTEPRRRNGRRRSVVAQEEEVRRLKSIHDTYADRMNILSLIYSIPANPQLPPSSQPSQSESESLVQDALSDPAGFQHVDESTSRSSPESSGAQYQTESRTPSQESSLHRSNHSSGSLPTSTAPLTLAHRVSSDNLNGGLVGDMSLSNRSSVTPTSRPSMATVSRVRAISNLPPRPPAPSSSPPSTPAIFEPASKSERSGPPSPKSGSSTSEGLRPRGNSVTHRRTGSGSRLEALREEAGASSLYSQQQYHYDHEADLRGAQPPTLQKGPRSMNGESPPLPALPSPSNSEPPSSTTPRNSSVGPEISQDSSKAVEVSQSYLNSRPRGASTLVVKSEAPAIKSLPPLINESPMKGTISQRRMKTSTASTILEDSNDGDDLTLPRRLAGASLPANATPSTLSNGGRNRASSQPVRPSTLSIQGLPAEAGSRSYAPSGFVNVPRKSSSGFRQSPQPPLAPQTAYLSSFPQSIFSDHASSLVPPPPVLPGQLPTTPTSPLPPMPPTDPLRKPYHLMNLLRHTMTSKSGGYITRRLHVPYDVWSQGGAKLINLPDKIRVVELLCAALGEVQNASNEFCGPSVSSGMGLGVGSITRRDGEVWITKLEDFSTVCDNVVSSFGKKLGVGEGFVVKKSTGMGSWGGKLTRQLDKLTNSKNLDSPMTYVQGLQRLFELAQLLDEHTKALNSLPIAPVYGALATDLRLTLELKFKRCSEFFASVILTFVIRDLSQLLDKYAKKGEKWLAE